MNEEPKISKTEEEKFRTTTRMRRQHVERYCEQCGAIERDEFRVSPQGRELKPIKLWTLPDRRMLCGACARKAGYVHPLQQKEKDKYDKLLDRLGF